mmetsp:Transcript_82938/g.168328  ORF Transcript_82938/g.168328 Transcript_82938/m.168328 type:complete len:112 (+) Transcript_82938:227-562(+)
MSSSTLKSILAKPSGIGLSGFSPCCPQKPWKKPLKGGLYPSLKKKAGTPMEESDHLVGRRPIFCSVGMEPPEGLRNEVRAVGADGFNLGELAELIALGPHFAAILRSSVRT